MPVNQLPIPLQWIRQFADAPYADMVFETEAAMNTYLTSERRYAGMVATCKAKEGRIFVLNNSKDEWLDVIKLYVDANQTGLQVKDPPADVATIENITLSGLQDVDGVTGEADLNVLVWKQTDPSENGIYLMKAGAWERRSDADTWDEHLRAYILVVGGVSYAGYGFYCMVEPGGTLETDAINWTIFSMPGDLTIENVGTGAEVLKSQLGTLAKLRTFANTNTVEFVEDDDEIKANVVAPFTSSFNATTDWTAIAGGFEIQFNHGFGAGVDVEVRDSQKKTSVRTESVTTNIERIVVPHDFRFAGTIKISRN